MWWHVFYYSPNAAIPVASPFLNPAARRWLWVPSCLKVIKTVEWIQRELTPCFRLSLAWSATSDTITKAAKTQTEGEGEKEREGGRKQKDEWFTRDRMPASQQVKNVSQQPQCVAVNGSENTLWSCQRAPLCCGTLCVLVFFGIRGEVVQIVWKTRRKRKDCFCAKLLGYNFEHLKRWSSISLFFYRDSIFEMFATDNGGIKSEWVFRSSCCYLWVAFGTAALSRWSAAAGVLVGLLFLLDLLSARTRTHTNKHTRTQKYSEDAVWYQKPTHMCQICCVLWKLNP